MASSRVSLIHKLAITFMSTNLGAYVHDHLAGAQFAVELLEDLKDHADDEGVRGLAAEILQQVQQDRETLQQFAIRIGEEPSALKEAAGWLAQKLSRIKLAPDRRFGVFEAVESLSLGILGKLALWRALATLHGDQRVKSLDLKTLVERAKQQHEKMESLRLALAPRALSELGDLPGEGPIHDRAASLSL
jgi:hypothetical protein